MVNIRKLESDLWESADLLRAGSKLTSNQYCMPVLGLIFLRYAYSRFKLVEKEILKNRPVRGGRVLPVEASDFVSKSALFLPREAQYEYLVNLPADIASAELTNQSGHTMNSLGEVVNNAMELVEAQSEQLTGVLPKDYTIFSDELLAELLRIFNNSALDEVGGDVIGRIYEYFLNKFAKNIAQDDGVFFTPQIPGQDDRQYPGTSGRCAAGPRLRQRRHVRSDRRFRQRRRHGGQRRYDLLRPGEGGVQRPTLSDEHGGTRAQRHHQIRRRGQHLLSRRPQPGRLL